MNRWKLTDEIRNEYKPTIEEWLNKIKTLTVEQIENMDNEEFKLELSDTKLNPYTLNLLIEELGYEEIESDTSGWERDFWNYFLNKKEDSICKGLCINGCGMTFELNLTISEFM